MAKRKKKSQHVKGKLLTAGALALGAYFLYGSAHAKQNRKKAKSWMLKAKAEVLERAEKLKELDRQSYERIVSSVGEKYKKLKDIDKSDIAALTKDLHGHWKDLEKEFTKGAKKIAKKPVKKTTKKKK